MDSMLSPIYQFKNKKYCFYGRFCKLGLCASFIMDLFIDFFLAQFKSISHLEHDHFKILSK